MLLMTSYANYQYNYTELKAKTFYCLLQTVLARQVQNLYRVIYSESAYSVNYDVQSELI